MRACRRQRPGARALESAHGSTDADMAIRERLWWGHDVPARLPEGAGRGSVACVREGRHQSAERAEPTHQVRFVP
jgi:hypothetical protein